MASETERSVICRSHDLVERGRGVRFVVRRFGETVNAFAIRWNGTVHAYLNRCAHRSMELDWNEGEFLDASGEQIICATHGARYRTDSGACIGGPCGNAGLIKIAICEERGEIRLIAGDTLHLVESANVV